MTTSPSHPDTSTDDALPTVDAVTARALLAQPQPPRVVDVRTPGEFETAHIDGAVNLPLDQLTGDPGRVAEAVAGRPLLVVCQSGNRARQACEKLTHAGFGHAQVLDGGMQAWLATGGQASRGRQRWSLERQVRLVAGGLVLLAIVASVWVPEVRYVAGLIGAGLVFAALSNTCAMGSLLARLPYNRGARCDLDTALGRLAGSGER